MQDQGAKLKITSAQSADQRAAPSQHRFCEGHHGKASLQMVDRPCCVASCCSAGRRSQIWTQPGQTSQKLIVQVHKVASIVGH